MKRSIMSVVLTVVLVIGLVPVSVLADNVLRDKSGYCGGEGNGRNLSWNYDSSWDLRLTISGTGKMKDYGRPYSEEECAPWHNDTTNNVLAENVVIEEGVTSIGNWAFTNHDASYGEFVIPSTVTRIGDYAFDNSILPGITLPDKLTEIGEGAFRCSTLPSVTIPNRVTAIGDSVFYACYELANVSLPSNLTSIGTETFYYCESLKKISLPVSLTYIGRDAFRESGLTNIELPSRMSKIEDGTFAYCSDLAVVTIPVGITQIGYSAFAGCRSLTDVYYNGTRSQWERIEIEEDNEALLNATIHFEDPLDKLLEPSSSIYNNDLALICAELSNATYQGDNGTSDAGIRSMLIDMGFSDQNIISDDYSGNLAYTAAVKKYTGIDGDSNTGVLVIVARGTQTTYEKYMDFASSAQKSYNGYPVFDIVKDFSKAILYGVSVNGVKTYPGVLDLIQENEYSHYKVLVTGHSLGGAAANLVAAQLTDTSKNKKDVFCYTFAALNSIKRDSPVTQGYFNIHNIYNIHDTFSPLHGGKYLASGMGRMMGKFGHMDFYVKDYRTSEQKSHDDLTQIMEYVNHNMDNIMKDIRNQQKDGVENSPYRACRGVNNLTDLNTRAAMLACPVDVDVLCEGRLVGRVVNNVVDETVTAIDIVVEDDVKYILYPDDKSYDLKITAFDEGSMIYLNQDMAGNEGARVITDIALVQDKTMTSEVGGSIEAPDVKLLVMDADNNEAVAEVLSDGTERPLNGTLGDALSWTYDPVAGTITVTGDMTSGSAVMAASYSGEGQMLSVGSITRSGGSAAVAPRAETIKLFWMDSSGKPLCASVAL